MRFILSHDKFDFIKHGPQEPPPIVVKLLAYQVKAVNEHLEFNRQSVEATVDGYRCRLEPGIYCVISHSQNFIILMPHMIRLNAELAADFLQDREVPAPEDVSPEMAREVTEMIQAGATWAECTSWLRSSSN